MPDFGRWTGNGGDPSLNEINRTDRFLDALAFENPVYSTDPSESELANLLSGWRDEVRMPALTAPVTTRDAVVALERATASRRRTRTMAVVGSAAAAMLALGGFVSVVAGAGPGDALYGLHTMFFGEQESPRNDAVMLASQQLAEVQQLIDQGQWQAAQDKLQSLTTTVAAVNDVEAKQDLITQWQELTVKAERQDANATVPPNAPPPAFPDLPAVVLDTTTSTTTPSTALPSPSTPLPTPTTPLPTPSTPLPTPTIPLPTPSNPIPTPSTPLPTPTPSTPLPTPQPSTPLPTPAPLPSPTAVAPLPTPTVVTPLPTPTETIAIPTRVPLPTPVEEPSEVAQDDEPAPEEPPVLEAPEPETVVTTTVVVPERGDDGPR